MNEKNIRTIPSFTQEEYRKFSMKLSEEDLEKLLPYEELVVNVEKKRKRAEESGFRPIVVNVDTAHYEKWCGLDDERIFGIKSVGSYVLEVVATGSKLG